MYTKVFKRFFDLFFSCVGIVLVSPIILIVIILLSIANKGKPFFFQDRPGKNERLFRLVKFKTMNENRDSNGKLLPDTKRLTIAGRIIRATSLDELPQLWNVIKGDMSLIGPRPLLVSYLKFYSEFERKRHNVRPGITGWAQVNGRNTISWEQKFEYDVWYVNNQSFNLDIKIFFLTIKKVIYSEGINMSDQETMEPFVGGGE